MSLLGDTLGWSRDEQTLSFHKAKDMTEITEAVDVEEALRLAEVGEYLYDKKAFSAGNGYDEPREFSICWDWQQSKPDEYGQGVLLAEAVAWHREMAADGIETQANKLRAELTRLQEENGQLRLAICGGEDAPGYADSLPLADILGVAANNLGSWREASDRAARLQEEVKGLRDLQTGDQTPRPDLALGAIRVAMGVTTDGEVKPWLQTAIDFLVGDHEPTEDAASLAPGEQP